MLSNKKKKEQSEFTGLARAVNTILDDPSCPVGLYNAIQEEISEGESLVLNERDESILARALDHLRQLEADGRPRSKGTPFEDLTLAEMLSTVLYHKDLPEPLEEGIMKAITDLQNEHIDQAELQAFERSPVFLEMLLRNFSPGISQRNRE